MKSDWRTRYDLALDAARQAGDFALGYYNQGIAVEWKPDNSPVTVADKGAEDLIRKEVKKHFPDDGFFGEEYGHEPGTSGYRWIIDPIDGTRSFVRHIPLWATLIGLEYKGEQIAGVTYIPAMKQTYRALRGDGAYMDDRRIRVSDVSKLSESLFCYSSISWFRKAGREANFLDLAAKTERQRGYGDFYGFVLVAQGACEIMLEYGVHPYDVAALKAIVEEAGGRMTDWHDVPTIEAADVIATNGKLHTETLAILNGNK
jgi:histidinol-phosphatase